jgi:hypothetical protein
MQGEKGPILRLYTYLPNYAESHPRILQSSQHLRENLRTTENTIHFSNSFAVIAGILKTVALNLLL